MIPLDHQGGGVSQSFSADAQFLLFQRETKTSGSHTTFMQCDLSDQVAVFAAVAAIDGPVNVLFNNAGVADTMPPATTGFP